MTKDKIAPRKENSTPKPKEHPPAPRTQTNEATSYLGGLFAAFHEQTQQYAQLTSQLLHLEARIELAEKTLSLTRDHLNMTINQTDSAAPHAWDKVLLSVRFVGVRLADACTALLKEKKKLTPDELLSGLNSGMYRFRTNSPLREIHAALLKQSSVKRVGQYWLWSGTAEQLPLRLRVVKAAAKPHNEVDGVAV